MEQGRIVEIIKYLTDKSNEIVSSNELAKAIEVSSRTIKRDIKIVIEEGNNYGYYIDVSNRGYSLRVVDEEKLNKILKFSNKKNAELNGEIGFKSRVILITYLLVINEYTTTDEIADRLYTSRSTISKEIREVKKVLAINNLRLNNKPYYGYYVEGCEVNKRRLLANYLEDIMVKNYKYLENRDILNVSTYNYIKEEVTRIFVKHNIFKPDNQLNQIQRYILITMLRINNKIDLSENENITVDLRVINVAKEIMNLISKLTLKDLSMEELVYIAFIIGNSYNEYSLMLNNNESFVNDTNITDLVMDFINEINKIMKVDFTKDFTLINGLVSHINSSLSRYSMSTNLDNPILNMIKTKYIEAYSCSLICNSVMKKKFDFELNENDLGYIALHFAAAMEKKKGYKSKVCIICENGIGFSQLIKSRIEEKINNIEIINTVPKYMISSLDSEHYDLIITTLNINKYETEIPIIKIDYDTIDESIEKIESRLDNINILKGFFKKIPEELFICNKEFNDKDELLKYLLNLMKEKGYLTIHECESIINREKLCETVINKKVALPHCVKTGDSVGAIIITKKPIVWGTNEVNIVILSCINTELGIGKNLFPLINRKTKDSGILEELLQAKDINKFISIISR